MRKIITGKRYGDWEIIEATGEKRGRLRIYKGRNVKCGHEKAIVSTNWSNSRTQGCRQCKNDMTGKRYGDWEIIEDTGKIIGTCRVYKGRNVKCGHEKTTTSSNWNNPTLQGCGQCLADKREIAKAHKQIITGEL